MGRADSDSTETRSVEAGTDAGAVELVLGADSVHTVFQPVIDLDTSLVSGFEALARGPVGPLQSPDALFAAARRAQRLPELDWLCRESAVAGARAAGMRSPLSLFVNAEPETLLADSADASRWASFGDLRCYCELTERSLTKTPGRLAAAIDQIRAQDWGVALDDVGADPASLALLPLIQPDVIKLDLRLLHDEPRSADDVDSARVLDAVLTQASATGAAVIAEGIETSWHLELARGYGVRYGQGYLLGAPGPLPTPLPSTRAAMPLLPRIHDRAITPGPFAVLASSTPTRILSSRAVTELARQLLAQALTLVPEPAVLIASDTVVPTELHPLMTALADPVGGVPLLGALGASQPSAVATPLPPDDPALHDFAVTVTTAHFAAALVARPNLTDPKTYDAAITFDRTLALAIANTLLIRL